MSPQSFPYLEEAFGVLQDENAAICFVGLLQNLRTIGLHVVLVEVAIFAHLRFVLALQVVAESGGNSSTAAGV